MTAAIMEGEDTESQPQAPKRLPPRPRVVVLVAIALRLTSLLGQHIHSHIVGQDGFNAFPYGGSDDGRYYYTTAEQLADGITPPYVLNWFPRVLSVFMDIGIRDLLALKLISFGVSSIAVVMMASMAWHLSAGMRLPARRWTVIVAAALGSLFPSNVFWTTNSLMRDGWILTFALVALWSFSSGGKLAIPRGRWVLGLLTLVAATSFRPYVLPVFVAALISSRIDLLNPMQRVKPRLASAAIRLVLVATGFIVLCILVAPALTDIVGFNILAWRTQEQLSGKGSSMGLVFDGTDPLVVVGYYLISFVSNAIGPLPVQVKAPNQMLAFVEFPFFALILAGLLRANYNDRLVRFCALFGLYWILLLGLWNDVLGNAARNRIMAWPILALAAAPAIANYLASKFHPEQVRAKATGRRRFDRRTKQRRSPAASERPTPPIERSDSECHSAPSVSELANWFNLDGEWIKMEMRQSDHDRRRSERRGNHRRLEVRPVGDKPPEPPRMKKGKVRTRDPDGPRKASASNHWFHVVPPSKPSISAKTDRKDRQVVSDLHEGQSGKHGDPEN